MTVKLRDYYKSFWSLYAFAAGIGFLPPLVHELLGDSSSAAGCLYPPLGDFQQLALGLTVFFLLVTSLVVFFCCRTAKRIQSIFPILLLIAIVAGVGCLTYLYLNFVRVIRIETRDRNVPVSIGFERSALADRAYKGWNDWAMLDDRGPWEPKIQELWTPQSIWKVRFSLWIVYTLTLACWVALVSLGVYQSALEVVPNEVAP